MTLGASSLPAISPRKDLRWILLIIVATWCVYARSFDGALLWDDQAHLTRLDLRSTAGLGRIWGEIGATQQYYPVLHSAFWLQHRLWGDAMTGYHVVNTLLHAAAACLLLLTLRRLAVPGAPLAALLFALHPVMAESVAWVTEQKNTLSLVFYFLAALAYLQFDASRQRRWHVAASGCFFLALLSKTVTASLPAALLVVFWWQRGRLAWRRDVLPLLPWFAASLGAGLLTIWVERAFIGARGADYDLSLLERSLLANRVIWFYLGKLLWPADLMFIYPRWDVKAAAPGWWGFAVLTLAVTAGLWRCRRQTRGPLAAWLLFIGSLFPALGFFNVYPFAFSYVADHFQYLASIMLLGALAAGLVRALPRPALAAAPLLLILAALTWRETGKYRDAPTLYRATLALNPGCFLAHNNLGNHLRETGEFPAALHHYREAVRAKPDFIEALANLANLLAQRGDPREAVVFYQRVLRLEPSARLHFDLALTLDRIGDLPAALASYAEAARLAPGDIAVQVASAEALARARQPAAAIRHYEAALRLGPEHTGLHEALADLYMTTEQPAQAVNHYEQALQAAPDDGALRNSLGCALMLAGRNQEAVAQLETAVRLTPRAAAAHYNLGLALRAAGRAAESERALQRAAELRAPAAPPSLLRR